MVRVYFSCVKSNRGTSLYQWTIPPFHIEISSEFHFFQTLHVKSPYQGTYKDNNVNFNLQNKLCFNKLYMFPLFVMVNKNLHNRNYLCISHNHQVID